MNLPTLTSYERLLPLEQTSVGETWLGRVTSADGLEFVLIEAFSSEISEREDLCERIAGSADRAADLRHDLIVPTRRAGWLEGHLAVVHDFPPGDSLARLLTAGRPSMEATLRIFANIADVLADVHDASTFHGALHPAVVSIGWDGRTRMHRFGTEQWVRKVRHDWGELNTRQLSYLSPEHCMNDPVDERTDIFNAGILLWELLTGQLLYEEDDDFERMRAICEREAPPPTRFNDAVPPLLNSLTLKALSIEPAERFVDGADLESAFEGVLSRSSESPSYKHVVQSFRSLVPERFEGWKGVEKARRQNDLEAALRRIGQLYGVDPSPALEGEADARQSVPGDRGDTAVTDLGPSRPDDHLPDHDGTEPFGRHDRQRPESGGGTDVSDSPYGDGQSGGGPEGLKADDAQAQGFEFEDPDEVSTTIDENISVDDVTVDGDFRPSDVEQAATDDEGGHLPADKLDDQLEDQQQEAGEQRSAQSLLLEEDEPEEADEAPTEQLSRDEERRAEEVREQAVQTNVLDPDDMAGGETGGGGPEDLEQDPTEHTATLESDDIETIDELDDVDGGDEPDPDGPGGGIQVPGDARSTEHDARDRAARPAAGDGDVSPASETLKEDEESDRKGRRRAERRHPGDGDTRPPGDSIADQVPPNESDPDEVAADLRSMSIDDWLDEDDEDDQEFREPFSLDRVIEDQGEPEQKRVRKPALEVIRLGENQPLDVSVLRGRQRWAIEGEPVEIAARGNEGTITIRSPAEGWIARASSPGERSALPAPPAEISIQPGDVAQISDGDVTYRIRFFHPPQSPNHIERENMGRKLSLYGVALAAAIVLHTLGALGIITLHTSFGVAMSVGDKPKKEVFAEGKLKKIDQKTNKKKKKKEPPEPPEPKPEPEPVDPSEQEAEVPEQVQDELDERMKEKQKQAENKSEAEALAAAFEGSGEDSKDSIEDAVSNIDAADSPADSGTLEVGGKIKPSEGNEIQVTQGDGESELGDIGSDIDSSTGKLTGRDKEGEVRGTVDSVDSQTKVEGQLAREKVAKVIQQHQGEIQGCYERELLSNAGLAGKVTFEWTITRQGDVSGAREKSSTLNSAAVSNCILKIIRGMSFPKPKGGSVTISYPFMFRSGG